MNWIKRLYTRIFPASKHQLKVQTEMLQKTLKQMEKSNGKLLARCTRDIKSSTRSGFQDVNNSLAQIKTTIAQQNDLITELHYQIDELRNENKMQLKEMQKMVSDYNADYTKSFKDITQLQRDTLAFAHENNWAFVFNNTVAESEWLTKKSLSLGRWAIGYQCSYVLYRVLNEVKPKHILELGLGQSTKIIGQYSNYYKEVQHTVVESDPQWIDFFTRDYPLDENTKILQCDYAMEDFQEHSGIRVFKGLDEKIKDKKYDLIIVDAPFGGDMNELSRIDILKNIPQCLNDSFVIIFDDINRLGERNTFNTVRKILDDNDITYAVGSYHGQNITGVIVSDDLKYIRSM